MSESIPNRFAGTYVRELVNIDPSNPWYGYKYFGQFNRRAYVSAQKAAEARWRAENSDALRNHDKMGLLFCIKKFGKGAFRNRVLEWRGGDDGDELQIWVDTEEIRLIAEGGGPFRGIGTKSTLNLTHGGQGAHFASHEAKNAMAWKEFCNELLKYETANDSTLVWKDFESESGYRLGAQVSVVRQGQMWKGTKYESEREAWLESRKRWHWSTSWNSLDDAEKALRKQKLSDSHSTLQYIEAASIRSKQQWANASDETREQWCQSLSDGHSTEEYLEAASARGKQKWANATPDIRQQWCKALSDAHSTPEYLEGASIRSKNMWANCTEEARKQWCQTLSKSHTPENIARQVSALAKTTASRHEKTRAILTGAELEQFDKKIANTKASHDRQRQKLQELRKVPGWETANEADMKRARAEGVLADGRGSKKFSSSYEQQKHQLSILRQIPGWEKSNHFDLKRARDEGVMPDLRKQERPILATASEPAETPPPPEEPKPEKKPLWWLDSSSDEEDKQ
jgi:hypothetical protein